MNSLQALRNLQDHSKNLSFLSVIYMFIGPMKVRFLREKGELNMNPKSLIPYVKLTITIAVLSFAGCSKSETPANPPSAATTAATTVATQAAAPAPNSTKVSCKRGKEVRTLEITKKAAGCLLDYQKKGKTTAVSKSPNGLDHCKQEEIRIQTKLEHVGFTCT